MSCSESPSADFEEILKKTYSNKPQERKQALKEFCPCHVKKNIDVIWDRIFEMLEDESPIVRDQVVHSLCDGSPNEKEEQVIEALEKLWNDPDATVRKKVRTALNSYRRTGKWNVLWYFCFFFFVVFIPFQMEEQELDLCVRSSMSSNCDWKPLFCVINKWLFAVQSKISISLIINAQDLSN